MVRRHGHFCRRIYGSWRPFTCDANVWSSGYAGMTLSETQKLSTGPTFPVFGMSSPNGDETHCSAMWWDSMTTCQPTAHYHRSQQQELVTALVAVGGDSQDARAFHGSSRSAMVHPSAFVLNGLRLVVVATPGWRNGPLLSTRSDDDDDDDDDEEHVTKSPSSLCVLPITILSFSTRSIDSVNFPRSLFMTELH